MGFRVHLIAVDGKSVADIHADLHASPTGTYEEIAESPLVGTELKSGAYLIYVNDDIIPDPNLLSRLSQGAAVVSCYANETVMNSLTSRWQSGNEEWSVFHDAQVAIDDLQVSGSLPVEFDSIRKRLVAEQNGITDTDYFFDIPIDLFVAQGGMRYDEDPDSVLGTDEPWEILRRL